MTKLDKCPSCGHGWAPPQELPHTCEECEKLTFEVSGL